MQVLCGQCGGTIDAEDAQVGETIHCPHCECALRVPPAEEQPLYAREGEEGRRQEGPRRLPVAHPSAPYEEPEPPERERRKRHTMVTGLIAAGGIIAVALGLGVGIGYLLSSDESEALTEEQGTTRLPADRALPAPVGPSETPSLAPADVAPRRKGVPHRVEMISVSTDVFATGGYCPAPVGFVYWKVKLALTAGDTFIAFGARGEDVSIKVGAKDYRSLGTLLREPDLPIRARPGRIEVPVHQTREVELLFEVNQAGRVGELRIADVGNLRVGPVTPPPGGDVRSAVGAYREIPPRNLKPLLRDPVMAAIQSAPDQRLVIGRERSELTVRIDPAGVTGTVRPANGVLEGVVHHRGDSLICKLRPIRSGEGLILYLKDAPFHQLTYAKE